MLYLLLCILFSTSLIIIFRLFHQFKVPVAQAIFVNYVVCVVLGSLLLKGSAKTLLELGFGAPWLWVATLVGTLFFITFYLLGESAKLAGVTITTVAQRVSLVVPVTISLLFWQSDSGKLSLLKIAGLALALVAVALSSWRKVKDSEKSASGEKKAPYAAWLLPVIVFANAGLADSMINFANYKYLTEAEQPAFTLATFTTAAVLGLVAQAQQLVSKGNTWSWRSLPGGLVLGIPNLLALFFLLKSLSAFDNSGAFVYPINNMGVILISAGVGAVFFKERLRKINWLGILLALVALGLLLYEELGSRNLG